MLPILFCSVNTSMAKSAKETFRKLNQDINVENLQDYESIEDVIRKFPDIQVFISRGVARCKKIETITGRPCIQVSISLHEIFEKVQLLADRNNHKIAVVSSKFMIGGIRRTYKFGNSQVIFYPAPLDNQVAIMDDLIQDGVTGLVGAKVVVDYANNNNLDVEFLNSGSESITIALEQALSTVDAQNNERKINQQRTEQVLNYSQTLFDAIENASAATEELTASAEELASIGKESASSAKEASEEIANTGEIIRIVKSIAKQSNLLGLNAAIEAARSGENGKGFTVVAQEIRKLAEESAKQATHVEEILTLLEVQISRVLKNTEQISQISGDQAYANEDVAQKIDNMRITGEKLISMAKHE